MIIAGVQEDQPGSHCGMGLVFLITVILGYVALHVGKGRDWLNWIIPIALIVWAIKSTARYPERVPGAAGGAPGDLGSS
jgi:hypothetical protein